MATQHYPSASVDEDKLPIYTHTYVLGVDIGVWQRDGGEIDIKVWPRDPGAMGGTTNKHLSAWARRNLFNGAGPK